MAARPYLVDLMRLELLFLSNRLFCLLLALGGGCTTDPSQLESESPASTGASGTGPGGSATAGTGASAPSSATPGSSSKAGAATAGSGARSTSSTAGSGTAGTNSTPSGSAAQGSAAAGNGSAAASGAAATGGSSTTTGIAAAGSDASTTAAGTSASNSPAGSGSPAAGSGAPSSGTCQGTLCESFEAGSGETLDANWEVAALNCMGTGTAAMDSSQAHTGTRSVRVNGGGGYCNHVFVKPKAMISSAAGPLYARFFVRFEKALTQSHVTFLALRDDAEMKDLRMGGQSEILMWNRESDDATLPELSPTGIAGSVKPEIGKWLCVEFLIDGQAPKLETWLDGQPVAGLIVEGEPTPDIDAQWQRKADWRPSLSDVRFGWESYGSDENTLWFDDIVVGTTRVGCGS